MATPGWPGWWEDSFFLEGLGMSLKLERRDGVGGGAPRSGNGVSISLRVYLIICFQMPAPLSGMSRARNLKIPTQRGTVGTKP